MPTHPDRAPTDDPDTVAADPREDVIAGRAPDTPILPRQGGAVAAVALGGAIGAVARWAVGLGLPTTAGAFPLGTFLVNVVGCLLMGVLVVVVSETREAHPIVRPFLGVGVLGGFTTFSTFAVEGHELVDAHHLGLAAVYLVGTALAAVLAAAVGLAVARRLVVRA